MEFKLLNALKKNLYLSPTTPLKVVFQCCLVELTSKLGLLLTVLDNFFFLREKEGVSLWLSELRIQSCHESQMQLGSGMAVAVV